MPDAGRTQQRGIAEGPCVAALCGGDLAELLEGGAVCDDMLGQGPSLGHRAEAAEVEELGREHDDLVGEVGGPSPAQRVDHLGDLEGVAHGVA